MDLIKRTNSDFDKLVKSFFGGNEFYTSFVNENSTIGKTNIKDNGNAYLIQMSLPGFKKEDINLDLDQDVLVISSDYENSNEDKNDNYYRKEFMKQSFVRSFYVPEDVDESKIDATMEDGILNVSFPKKEKIEKDKKISIKVK